MKLIYTQEEVARMLWACDCILTIGPCPEKDMMQHMLRELLESGRVELDLAPTNEE